MDPHASQVPDEELETNYSYFLTTIEPGTNNIILQTVSLGSRLSQQNNSICLLIITTNM